ncbi:hypothetical protein CBR_g32384 [Chara braunii]|uniref:HAT C-terminal dimerisation domain-containing protein n=1 Tax=Chara braunii TaxID=69332 RepID=A0A388JYF1_CHABU|nr:hypothetical protein CBR_g32384 [Chara braunii]|eukprot:GBG62795.1 hypothetical protein CBR_g32384 [Chara braunii]
MAIWRRLHRVGFEMPPDLMERVQRAIEESASDDDDGPVLEDDAVGRGGGVAMDGEAGEAVHGEAGSGVDEVTRGVVADGETPVRRPALSRTEEQAARRRGAARQTSIVRTDMLLSPIHTVARLLDPVLRDIAVFNNVELMTQFEAVVERLIGKRGSKMFDDCLDQLYEFQMARGVFGTTRAVQRAKKDNEVLWWEAHGAGHPEIKALAVKVLSIWTTSSPAERNWSTWSLVQTKSRNKLYHQRTKKLVYSHWSLRVKSRGDDGPTVVGGWLGLAADWADDDLEGDQAGLTDAVDDGELGHEAAPSGAGSTTIRHDPVAAGTSTGVPRRGEVEEGMEWGDMEEEEDDDDVDNEDEIPHDEWVDDRSDSD